MGSRWIPLRDIVVAPGVWNVRHDAWVLGCAVLTALIGGCLVEEEDPPPIDVPLALGAPCERDTQCLAGLTCWQSDLLFTAWCTRECATDDDCPLGSGCVEVEPSLVDEGSILRCAPRCERAAGSRGGCPQHMSCDEGGLCSPFTTCDLDEICGDGRCELASGRCVTTDGNPSAGADDPCREDTDCRSPNGICLSEECYHLDCDLGGDYACKAGEICDAYFPSNRTNPTFRCKRVCEPGVDAISPTEGGACLDGEICVPPEAEEGPVAASGQCDEPLGEFFVGREDARILDPCETVADCRNPLGYAYCGSRGCQLNYCAAAVFAGEEPCGPGGVCLFLDPPPEGVTPEEAASYRSGSCARLCDESDPCPAGSTCSAQGWCS